MTLIVWLKIINIVAAVVSVAFAISALRQARRAMAAADRIRPR